MTKKRKRQRERKRKRERGRGRERERERERGVSVVDKNFPNLIPLGLVPLVYPCLGQLVHLDVGQNQVKTLCNAWTIHPHSQFLFFTDFI